MNKTTNITNRSLYPVQQRVKDYETSHGRRPLNTFQLFYTATLLSDGRVLVVGGFGVGGINAGYLSSAEVYNPSTNTWTAAGNMAAARKFHTATLLSDGRVLVVGGIGSSGIFALASVEIYIKGVVNNFDTDGQTDILVENTTTGQKAIWFMNGSTITSGSVFVTVPTDWRMAGTGDFNADGQTDILIENTSTGQKAIWFMSGSTISSGSVFVTVPTDWRIAATGDFNGDGKTDILIENTSTGQKGIWFMNGSTITSGSVFATVPTDWRMAGTGDFNGAGQTDILIENTSTGQKGIWFMNGASITSGSVFATVPTDWRISGP